MNKFKMQLSTIEALNHIFDVANPIVLNYDEIEESNELIQILVKNLSILLNTDEDSLINDWFEYVLKVNSESEKYNFVLFLNKYPLKDGTVRKETLILILLRMIEVLSTKVKELNIRDKEKGAQLDKESDKILTKIANLLGIFPLDQKYRVLFSTVKIGFVGLDMNSNEILNALYIILDMDKNLTNNELIPYLREIKTKK
ncbi:hypothetical protein ABLO26_21030 [Neobacillus sp. 179-J 1A1 HS]|uniref:hypothetical protein n=1 Tax=Neobacillus driksii TaxID=3035913 RepID=UPI0035BBAC5C